MTSTRAPSALAMSLLRRARVHVRAHARSADYYRAADRFSEMFLGRAFQIEPDYFKAVGTDYSAIDCLYEDLDEELDEETDRPGGAAAWVTERLQEMTRLDAAQAALEPLDAALAAPSCAPLEVCRALLAAITVRGHEALEQRGLPGLHEAWSHLWQDRVWRQNSQQARLHQLIQLMRAPAERKPALLAGLGATRDILEVRGTDFVQGVHEYLERYAETGAASVALVGGLPFAQALSSQGLEELLRLLQDEADFLGRMSRVMRFAQDVRFDPSEPLNAGVMGYAAWSGERLVDLEASRLPKARLDAWLRQEWDTSFARTRQDFDAQVGALEDATLRPALQAFVAGFHAIAARLADAGHEP